MVVSFGVFPCIPQIIQMLLKLGFGFPDLKKKVSSMTTAPMQPGLASAPCVGVEG